MTQQDTQPPAETLAKDDFLPNRPGHCSECGYRSHAIGCSHESAALTRRAGGDAIPAGDVEALAQFLHDEGGFGEAMTDRTWPEHDGDTGQREGGWVKIVPPDVLAHFRDVARRWLLPRIAATPTPPAGGDAIGQSDGDPDGWLAVKVNGEGGIVMPYGPLHAGPDRPADPRYRWAPFYLGEPQ